MSDTELAWAAGFYDGEGSTYICLRRRGGRTWQHIAMHITQAEDLFVLERFQQAVGAGVIRGPYRPPNWPDHYKDRCSWSISGTKPSIAVLRRLWPHLSPVKRAQAENCMGQMEEYWDSLRRN